MIERLRRGVEHHPRESGYVLPGLAVGGELRHAHRVEAGAELVGIHHLLHRVGVSLAGYYG